MNILIIEKYIKKLTKQDIINYTTKQNISLTESEINIIYNYIKTKYKDFLNGNEKELLSEIKQKVKPTTYQKIEQLYNLYQNKI